MKSETFLHTAEPMVSRIYGIGIQGKIAANHIPANPVV
jgi:hypothetical protein